MSTDNIPIKETVKKIVDEKGESCSERQKKKEIKKISTLMKIKRLLTRIRTYPKVRKQEKKRREICSYLRHLRDMLLFTDKKLFRNRQEKRRFWRNFIKEGSIRKGYIEDLVRMYDMPGYVTISKKEYDKLRGNKND